MKNEHLIPLDIGDKHAPHRAVRRDHFLNSARMSRHSFLSDARTGINAILHHRVSVLQKHMAEMSIVFTFFRSSGRKIKEDYKPAHFIVDIFHGS